VARVKAQKIPPLVKLLCQDRRYKLEAYNFIRMGLTYAQEVLGLGSSDKVAAPGKKKGEADERRPRHVSGQDLCWALRQLAQEQYGRLAKLVLGDWGIHSTSDFGEIVYNLIKIGEMSKSESDRREDFDEVYDFDRALVREYVIAKED
jgi:uncharacterized repeat protein (TIGR04138 family)